MITIIMGLVIGAIIGRKLDYNDPLFGLISGGLIGGLIGLLIAGLIGPSIPGKYMLEDQFELAALRDNVAMKGNFFLASGSFGEEYYYRFYKKERDGALIPNKIVANRQVRIYEEERTDGVLKIFKMKPVEKTHFNLFGLSTADWCGRKRYEFHIPKGSILHQFELDLR